MKNIPRITEIIKIEPFKITCRWTTGEIRINDFEKEFENRLNTGKAVLLQLKEYEKFENVIIKDGTLQWYSISVSFKGLTGKILTQPLDLDPDNLYQQSKSISFYKLVPDTTTIEDIQFWSLWMSTPDVDNVGSSGSANYSPEISANANNLRLTAKIGPAIEIYDPEWSAWLA